MNKIKLITDSSCDLPIDIIEKYNINIVPLNVAFGEEHFVSGIDIDNETFYKRMSESKELPKTSCPSPDRFIESYEGEEDILILTLASKLSATHSTAVLAKEMFLSENSHKNIHIIDTDTGSIGAGLLTISAAKMIEEGKAIDEIVTEIERLKTELVFYGGLETLENAIKGGRVNPLAGKIINSLNLKVIVKVKEGEVKPIDKARGENNSIKKVIGHICDNGNDFENRTLAIAHANAPDKAQKVRALLEEKQQFKDVIMSEVGSVMGTYTSQGAILVCVL